MKKQVCVIFGGASSENVVSCRSAYTILSSIDTELYDVLAVGITMEGQWYLYEGAWENIRDNLWIGAGNRPVVLSAAKKCLYVLGDGTYETLPVDVVFPVLHGKNGEDGTIQGLFELAKLPYVGCGVLSSAVSMDKVYTKMIVDTLGVTQAPYVYVQSAQEVEELKDKIYALRFPVFVKASRSGSSKGVYKVDNYGHLKAAVAEALHYDSKVLIEEGIVGREIECAVFQSGDEYIASYPGEILADDTFYSFDAKYNNPQSYTEVQPDLPEGVAEEIREAAVAIFKQLDCRSLSRVDFFLEEDTGRVIFNEINTLPGFTSISMYPMMMQQAGIEIKTLVNRFIADALDGIKR
ncbi:MAG: D-alanine--D-alanine ligase [Clostridia bacterium]|nr:D-alanine--D-alanine ligase [Clostridia bacterium]